MKQQAKFGLMWILACATSMAPAPPPAAPPASPAPAAPGVAPRAPEPPRPPEAPQPPLPRRGPMERAFHGAPGRWWHNPDMAQRLGLSADQQKRMDDIFQQSRLKLIDLTASLQKEEAVLEPLMEAPQGDENRIVAQID